MDYNSPRRFPSKEVEHLGSADEKLQAQSLALGAVCPRGSICSTLELLALAFVGFGNQNPAILPVWTIYEYLKVGLISRTVTHERLSLASGGFTRGSMFTPYSRTLVPIPIPGADFGTTVLTLEKKNSLL